MAQHDHDHATQDDGRDETGARRRPPETATPSDGGTPSEDEAIFHPFEKEAEPLLSEGDRELETPGNSSEERETAVEAAEPGPPPRRKKHRQTLTLVLATLGLVATVATVATFHFRDKNERLRAFATWIENALTPPPKKVGGAGEAGNSPQPARIGTAPSHNAEAEPPKVAEPETGAAGETTAGKLPEATQTPPTNEQPAGRPEPESTVLSRSASGKPAEVGQAETLAKRIDELERIARSALAAAEEARSSAEKSSSAGPSTAAPSPEQGNYLDALEGRIDELDSQIRALREKLEAPKGETRLPREQAGVGGAGTDKNEAAIVVVAQSLIQALDRGRPYVSEHTALAALGADPGQLAELEPFANSGAPTARQLLESFAPVAKRLRAVDAPRPDAPYADRLLQGVGRWVKIRPAGTPPTDGVSDIVGQIEAALGRGEIAAAADAFAKLPETAASEAREWGDAIRRRRDAEKAADSILSSAIGALGRTKS